MTYCSDCGRPLADGEVCNCTAGQQPYQPAPQPGAQACQPPAQPEAYQAPPQQSAPYPQAPPVDPQAQYAPPQAAYGAPQPGYAQPVYAPPKQPSALGGFFKGFFGNPTDSSMHLLGGKQSDSLILGGIMLVLSGLYIPLIFRSFFSWAIGIYARYWNATSREVREIMSYIEYPNVMLFVAGALGAAVLILLVAVIWMILGRGPNVQMNFKTALAAACTASFPASCCMLLACVLGFASIRLGMLLVILGAFAMLAQSASMLRETTGKRGSYLFGAIFCVAVLIALFMVFQILDTQVMNIAMDGDTLGDSTHYRSISELFGELVEEMFRYGF